MLPRVRGKQEKTPSALATSQLKAFYTPDVPSQDEQHKNAKCSDTKCSDLNLSRREFATEIQENKFAIKGIFEFCCCNTTYRRRRENWKKTSGRRGNVHLGKQMSRCLCVLES